MATYECKTCGMSVNATCAKCNEPLNNDILTKDDGSEVQIGMSKRAIIGIKHTFTTMTTPFLPRALGK